MATVMEFSGPQDSHLLGSLGTPLKQINVVSLALTYESPAVIGPALWMYLGTVTEGGDTRKAGGSAGIPGILPTPRSL